MHEACFCLFHMGIYQSTWGSLVSSYCSQAWWMPHTRSIALARQAGIYLVWGSNNFVFLYIFRFVPPCCLAPFSILLLCCFTIQHGTLYSELVGQNVYWLSRLTNGKYISALGLSHDHILIINFHLYSLFSNINK